MTSSTVIRFPFPLRKVDTQAIERLEAEFDEIPVSGRIGPDGERQVRTSSGAVYNLAAVPKFRARRMAYTGHGPLPPAGGAALARKGVA